MNRITLWKTKLKVAKAELRIRDKEHSAAQRNVARVFKTILDLEAKIATYMAKLK